MVQGRRSDQKPYRLDLSCLNSDLAKRVITERPSLEAEFVSASGELALQLPPPWRDLTQAERGMVFAAALAHNLKPYGPGTTADLDAMLSAATLDCSNYGLLAHHLARLGGLKPGTGGLNVAFVGWDGGRIGNHQTLFAADRQRTEGAGILLDPTTGLAARTTFDAVASGRPVPARDILLLNVTPALEASRNQFISALVEGAFRPSELMYYYESMEQLLSKFGHPGDWPTPGAAFWRAHQAAVAAR